MLKNNSKDCVKLHSSPERALDLLKIQHPLTLNQEENIAAESTQ
jgi:hypothetical protein